MAAQLICNQWVAGSTPVTSSKKNPAIYRQDGGVYRGIFAFICVTDLSECALFVPYGSKNALSCSLQSALYRMPGGAVLCLFIACLIAKKPVRCVSGRALVRYGVQYPFKMFSASSVFAVSSSSACDLSIASMMLHRSVWYMGNSRQSASKSYSPQSASR